MKKQKRTLHRILPNHVLYLSSLVSHLSLFMTDLRNDRYAASVGAKHYLTSAKLNKGLDELFLDLSRRTLHAPILFFFFPFVSLQLSRNASVTLHEGMLSARQMDPAAAANTNRNYGTGMSTSSSGLKLTGTVLLFFFFFSACSAP